MHQEKQEPCRFLVVQARGPAQLGMLDVKTLEVLSVNCKTIDPRGKNQQINKQTTQDKSSMNKNLKGNVTADGKCNKNKLF